MDVASAGGLEGAAQAGALKLTETDGFGNVLNDFLHHRFQQKAGGRKLVMHWGSLLLLRLIR
jgi:hypothetical protein